MATQYTSLLGLALPVTGELSGSWGDVVNDSITSLLDSAISGTTSITTDADTTLTTTTGAANQARQAIILWNPASGTTTRNITAPAQSKIYTVINASGGTQSIVFRGVGPTTGVTIVKGESAVVAWNGTDFIKISNAGGSASFTNVTVSGTTTLSGLTASTALALDASKNVVSVTNTGTGNNVLSASPTLTGTISGANASLSGTLGVTGVATFTAQPILSSLTASQAVFTDSSKGLVSNAITGTGNVVMSASPTLTGTITAAAANFSGAVALGDAAADNITVNGTVTSNLIFTDNTYDIGASGATRPRNLFLAGNATVGGDIVLTGSLDLTNLEVTNIKAKDGTAGMQIADSTGVVSFTANPVMSGGTANGVAYLNGSKVLTTGSALNFDGSRLALGTATSNIQLTTTVNTNQAYISLADADGRTAVFRGPNSGAPNCAQIGTTTNHDLAFLYGNAEQMRLTSTGLGIGTSSPAGKLDVTANAAIMGYFRSSGGSANDKRLTFTTGGDRIILDASENSTGAAAALVFATGGTERMRLDSSGNLGIGTSSPDSKLTVVGATAGTGPAGLRIGFNGTSANYFDADTQYFRNGAGSNSLILAATAQQYFISGSEQMRLTSTGLGIGTSSPGYKLTVAGTSGSAVVNLLETGVRSWGIRAGGTATNTFDIADFTAGVTRLTIDSSGNLGLGVTPSAWSLSGLQAFQVKNGSLYGYLNEFGSQANAYYNSGWKYITSAPASQYTQTAGQHQWFNAPSGTAGNAISFTQAMTLDASGDLMIGGTTSGGRRLNVNGTVNQVAAFATTATGAYSPTAYNGANCGRLLIQGGSASGSGNGIVFTQGGSSELWFGQVQESGGAGAFVFQGYNGSSYVERMRLDSSGNLGLRITPSAWASLDGGAALQIPSGGLYSYSNFATFLSENSYYANGDKYIVSSVAAAKYVQNSGEHQWYTAPSGTAGNAISFTQAMTLTAAGDLLVRKTATGVGTVGFAANDYIEVTRDGNPVAYFTRLTSDGDAVQFRRSSGAAVGSISVTATATAYNTSSDYRLKNITGPITNSGAYIDSLNPVEGTWKVDGSTFVGLIAHEVQEASRTPVATGVKDGEEMQGMDYSSAEIIANLIAEVKALRTRVAALESI